ncbi:MAG: T9SS type A sorting domain-containing protein [Saprospiraceae bacterium]|nr:T9SS type A sorting domain-containing protein [Saprospiraceae bacterium]
MPSNGQVTVPATRWNNNSFDNCTANANLIIRVERLSSGDGINPPGPNAANILFTCADLGSVPVRMWVGDADGNWDFCETFMVVQNNMGADCPPVTGGGIEGLVYTESTEKVEKVEVKLTGDINNYWMTGNEGNFNFSSLLFGTDFTVTPKRNDLHENGISTIDLMMIQRHILGNTQLGSPYKIIGADVNHDERLSAADLVELRKLILATIPEFSNNTSWRFVDEKYTFVNPANPLDENFTEKIDITNFYGNVPMLKFIAIKVGDMNGSVKANSFTGTAENRNANSLIFDVTDTQLAAGKEYTVDFRSSDFQQIAGYQFTLKFNPAVVSLKDVKPGALRVNDSNFGLARLEEGVITTSWNDIQAISLGADDVLFSLTFKANQAAQLSDVISINSEYTRAEAYTDVNSPVMGVNLNFQNANSGVASNGFELFQNKPNPFNANTTIGFNLPEEGNATITIYDMTGKVIRVIDNNFARGYNEVQVNSTELGTTPGVLYYELKTTYATATKKMVLLN